MQVTHIKDSITGYTEQAVIDFEDFKVLIEPNFDYRELRFEVANRMPECEGLIQSDREHLFDKYENAWVADTNDIYDLTLFNSRFKDKKVFAVVNDEAKALADLWFPIDTQGIYEVFHANVLEEVEQSLGWEWLEEQEWFDDFSLNGFITNATYNAFEMEALNMGGAYNEEDRYEKQLALEEWLWNNVDTTSGKLIMEALNGS